MDLRVSIVSYNTRELLARCLDSLRANPPDGEWEVVVVDNASADDTVAMLADGYPEVRCLALPDNRGYAAGNNRALADCEARYFLILNSDIEVHEGALTRLVDYLDRHPQVGLTAARLVLPDGRVQDSGGPRPTLLEWFCEQLNLTRLAPVRHALGRPDFAGLTEPTSVYWLTGACLCCRAEVLAGLGGLDEGYWMYWEDVDLCDRFRREGWDLVYLPEAVMDHVCGGSSVAGRAETVAANIVGAARYFGRDHPLAGAAARGIGLVAVTGRWLVWSLLAALGGAEARRRAELFAAARRRLGRPEGG